MRESHESQMAMYVRNQRQLTDAQFEEYKKIFHDAVGEYNFDLTHSRVNHSKDCPEGDYFTSDVARSFNEHYKVPDPNEFNYEDMMGFDGSDERFEEL